MDSRDKADISEASSQAIDHDEDHLKGEKAEITFNYSCHIVNTGVQFFRFWSK